MTLENPIEINFGAFRVYKITIIRIRLCNFQINATLPMVCCETQVATLLKYITWSTILVIHYEYYIRFLIV